MAEKSWKAEGRSVAGAHCKSVVQIEVTTVCNFDCFYCAGRNMPQQHMKQDVFDSILASLPEGRCKVSLQGEGEPTLHPEFITMAKQVAESGKTPYTITNCSGLDSVAIAELFPEIGVSLDTLDPDEAERVGRHDLKEVLANLDRLIVRMGPQRIIVHTVNYGQSMGQLLRFLKARKLLRHIMQPLQAKEDYTQRYPAHRLLPREPNYHFRCRYLLQPIMRYYDVTGRKIPCCYIKDSSRYVSTEHTRAMMQQRILPDCCIGCREIVVRSQ